MKRGATWHRNRDEAESASFGSASPNQEVNIAIKTRKAKAVVEEQPESPELGYEQIAIRAYEIHASGAGAADAVLWHLRVSPLSVCPAAASRSIRG